MKIALLSGAYKNAGDFLIVQRSKELLKYIYPDCIINEYERKKDLTPVLDEINKNDILILAGGPGYMPNVYPKTIPLVPNLKDIKIKIFILGMGWYGDNVSNKVIYDYRFTSSTKQFLKRVEYDNYFLGCRDFESARVLKNNGFLNTKMTGCPAWYDLKYVDKIDLNKKLNGTQLKDIYISDPGKTQNYNLAIQLVKYLKRKFPHSNIKFIFHRGIKPDAYTSPKVSRKNIKLKNEIEKLGIECLDISYGYKGFNVYNDCDLHIGFRVHAHIYNLSQRNASILIEEDGRGAGVNNALGLPNITAYDSNSIFNNAKIMKFARKLFFKQNPYLENNLDDYLFELFNNDFLRVNQAFVNMNSYFSIMIEHIKTIEKNLN